MRKACPDCGAALIRSRRTPLERILLAPLPPLRPYRCPGCGFRGLRWAAARVSRPLILAVLLGVLVGLLAVQILWRFGEGARRYEDREYRPLDMERYEYEQVRRGGER